MNSKSWTCAIFLPSRSTISALTAGMSILARSSVTSRLRSCLVEGVRIVSRTSVPALPLIFAVDSFDGCPAIDLPPTPVIRSSFSRPALAAGEPSYTWTMRSPRASSATLTPMPSNCGSLIARLNSLVSAGVK